MTFRKRTSLARHPTNDRELVPLSVMAFSFQLVLVIVALTTSADHYAYNKTQGALFICSVVMVLGFIGIKSALPKMLRHTWWMFTRPLRIERPQLEDAFWVLAFVTALLSLAFIVDFSFMRQGFRIGGAMAVTLALFVKALIQRFRSTRS